MKRRFEIPQGFSDEILYFRFFPLRSILVMLVLAIPGFIFVKLLSPFGYTMEALIIWIFIEGMIVASTIIPVPLQRWRNGGGVKYDRYFLRMFIRHCNRCLYVKGYDQLRYEQELRERTKEALCEIERREG